MINKKLFEKRERNRTFGIPNHRWNYNIKVDLKETGCND